MRRKKLLTAAMCVVLATASCTVSGAADNKGKVPVQIETAAETSVLTAEEESGGQPKSDTSSDSSGDSAGAEEGSGGSGDNSGGTEGGSDSFGGGSDNSGGSSGDSSGGTEGGSDNSGGSSGGSGEGSGGTEGSSGGTEGGSGSTEGGTEGSSGDSGSGSETTPGSEAPGAAETPESPTESSGETLPSETAAATEAQTSGQTESETEHETEIQEEETESENRSPYKTNEELIAHQNIVVPPNIQLEFRFTQVEKRIAVVSLRDGAGVYESKSEDARKVGELDYYGYCNILDDQNDGWYYIESGNVRGFVKSEALVCNEVAQRIAKIKGMDELPEARLLVARNENEAFDYTHTTTEEVMARPVYALASGETRIYEQRKESARVTGVLSDQALCYILADSDKDWVFVESGDARGFVRSSDLITGKKAEAKVADTGENNMALASVQIEPKDNKACYYTLTSVREASQSAKTREAMVNFALQFVGNPYVWGGTSLTNGADCSGFVQSIYAYFGYSLPRVADAQAGYGMQIPIESAEPGDLIFYAKNGYVYHVSMYIGNGQVVQAANSRAGIITSGIGGNAVWATRIING